VIWLWTKGREDEVDFPDFLLLQAHFTTYPRVTPESTYTCSKPKAYADHRLGALRMAEEDRLSVSQAVAGL